MATRAAHQEVSRRAPLFALSEDDGQNDEDVRELTATQDRVTFGGVLQVARGTPATTVASGGFFGADNLVARRQKAKDVVEKEFLSFSLSKLHPFVEVVGCVVSYSEDEIAKNPKLNEFFWSCDLSSASEDESSFHGERPIRAFEYYHDPKAKQKKATAESTVASPNFVVMCKFYRNHENRKEWFFHSIGESGSVRSSITPALTESMQVFLLDIIPEIEIPNRNALTNVVAVCAALNYDEFLNIEKYFPEKGIRKDDFARIILFVVMKSRPELQRVGRASALVALLFEMFEQIDINGDAWVDWEEFTTFCMSLGLIATCEQEIGIAGLRATSYRQELVGGAKARNFPYQVHKIKCFTQLKRIAVIENKSAVILMYDSDLVLHHTMNCVEKLLGDGDMRLAILDVDHVPTRNMLAISSSDHSITLWSIVNATTGAYVFSSKIVNRYPVACLKWCAPLKRLLASGVEYAQLWDIDTQRVDARLNHHKERISDYLELGNTGFFATSSFDHTIAVWEIASLKVAFVLEGHIQGVLTMDCMQSILLSSGFEYQAYCWSIASRSLLVTLGGHQHRLIGAKFVSNRSNASVAIAVTGDESGHFKLWDLSRCVRGSTTDLTRVMQTFEIRSPNLCLFRTFSCGLPGLAISASSSDSRKAKATEGELLDIITGNLHLYRFQAITQAEESAPPRHVVFNSVTNTFLGSVDGCITVWNANSGAKVEEPIHIRDADVCGIVFDLPRERKLFIATSKSQIHDGIISSLLFCPRTCCLISTGYDRNICVSHSNEGKTDIEVLRTVENAHESCITACTFSTELDFVATGDDSGCIHVYDFQKLYLLYRCESHHHEIRSLHFHCQAPILISGDSNGIILVWQATGVVYTTFPLMRLACQNSSTSAPGTPPSGTATHSQTIHSSTIPAHSRRFQHTSPITSICSTLESPQESSSLILAACENGEIFAWDYRILVNVARKRDIGTHFEYQYQRQGPKNVVQAEKYNPLLRMSHKQSVLKLRPEDRNGVKTGLSHSTATNSAGAHTHVGIASCMSTSSWTAHDDVVFAVKCVPNLGVVYTFSQDSKIKVWDATRTCIGIISTVVNPPAKPTTTAAATKATAQRSRSTTLGQQNDQSAPSTSSSAWKFTHHLSSDASHHHSRIATEVIRKHKRQKLKAHRRSKHNGSVSREEVEENADLADDSAQVGMISPLSQETSESPVKTVAKPTGIEAVLAAQAPFSANSIRAGIQQKLFGPSEAHQLKEISHNLTLMASLKKSALLPLELSPEELRRMAKRRTFTTDTGKDDDDLMRTMKNYPLEMQRRTATWCHAMQALDVAPSTFLKEKLCNPSSLVSQMQGPKSTPKRKLKLRMDANVVVTRNVSLPKLPELSASLPSSMLPPASTSLESNSESRVDEAEQQSHVLRASISEPTLASLSDVKTRGESHTFVEQNEGTKRNNIARKLKLYEEIIASNGGDDEFCQITEGRVKRHSQPSIRASASPLRDATNNSKLMSSMKKRASQGMVSIAGNTGSSGIQQNPFGPFYTVKQVIEFGNIITRFDEDFSGDIDQQEWVSMLQSFRPIFGQSDQETTEKLFRSLDRDDSGRISLREILPAMFSKATPEQLQQMKLFLNTHTDAGDKKPKKNAAHK